MGALNGAGRWWWIRVSGTSLALGILLGAAVSTAAGLWWTYGTAREINATLDAQKSRLDIHRRQIDGIVKRADDLDNQEQKEAAHNASVKADEERAVAQIRERMVAIEERLPPYISSAVVLSEHERHLSAQDGRMASIEAQLRGVHNQISALCAALVGISAASGKRAGCQ